MLNWYDRNIVKLDVALDNRDVVKILRLKAVSLYVSLRQTNAHPSFHPFFSAHLLFLLSIGSPHASKCARRKTNKSSKLHQHLPFHVMDMSVHITLPQASLILPFW